jgi:heat shock protein HtpX
MASIYDEISSNKRRTYLLFLMFFVIILGLGLFFGYWFGWMELGVFIALFIGVIWSFITYFAADRMVLAVSGARPVSKEEYPHIYNSVEGLALAAGIPTPQMYVIDDTALNAFATGRDPQHASIVLTTGIIQQMNRQEIEGVVAHEMSHIQNYDVRLMMLAAVMVGVIALLADIFLRTMFYSKGSSDRKGGGVIIIVIGIVFMILAPISAFLIQMALSRKREYLADANGALLTRYPEGLASALEKISADKEPLEVANKATAPLYIANPLKNSKSFLKDAFSTHPPIEDRINRLRAM